MSNKKHHLVDDTNKTDLIDQDKLTQNKVKLLKKNLSETDEGFGSIICYISLQKHTCGYSLK